VPKAPAEEETFAQENEEEQCFQISTKEARTTYCDNILSD